MFKVPVVADKTFTCMILTPESTVLKTEASFAVLPACDGEIGILRDRAPLLCRLGVGIVRLHTSGGPTRLFVDAGFAEVRDNKVMILTEQALAADQVDLEEEQAALAAARQRKAVTAEEHRSRRRELARATAKIRLASDR